MRLLYATWSLIAWTTAMAIQLAVFALTFPMLLVRPFERWQGGWPATVVGSIPYLTLSRRTVVWDRQYDPTRVSVFCCNHTSMLDGHVAVHALPHPFCGVENASHLAIPGYGWLMRLANAIPIPNGKRRTEALVTAAKERAGRGISILAFPEAHRTMDGKVRPFKKGVFVMAREAGLPIVPMAVRGMYHVFPKGTWIVRPGHLEVYLGPTLETKGLSDEQLEALAERTRQIVEGWIDRRETANPDPFEPPGRPGNREEIPRDWVQRVA